MRREKDTLQTMLSCVKVVFTLAKILLIVSDITLQQPVNIMKSKLKM